MSPAMRRQLATAYSRMLTMSTAAEKRGLDKTAHFEEAMRFARMQILSQELSKALQAESSNVSDQDIQDYYTEESCELRASDFRQDFRATQQAGRNACPAQEGWRQGRVSADASKTRSCCAEEPEARRPEEQEKAGEEAMKKEAAKLRERAKSRAKIRRSCKRRLMLPADLPGSASDYEDGEGAPH